MGPLIARRRRDQAARTARRAAANRVHPPLGGGPPVAGRRVAPLPVRASATPPRARVAGSAIRVEQTSAEAGLPGQRDDGVRSCQAERDRLARLQVDPPELRHDTQFGEGRAHQIPLADGHARACHDEVCGQAVLAAARAVPRIVRRRFPRGAPRPRRGCGPRRGPWSSRPESAPARACVRAGRAPSPWRAPSPSAAERLRPRPLRSRPARHLPPGSSGAPGVRGDGTGRDIAARQAHVGARSEAARHHDRALGPGGILDRDDRVCAAGIGPPVAIGAANPGARGPDRCRPAPPGRAGATHRRAARPLRAGRIRPSRCWRTAGAGSRPSGPRPAHGRRPRRARCAPSPAAGTRRARWQAPPRTRPASSGHRETIPPGVPRPGWTNRIARTWPTLSSISVVVPVYNEHESLRPLRPSSFRSSARSAGRPRSSSSTTARRTAASRCWKSSPPPSPRCGSCGCGGTSARARR